MSILGKGWGKCILPEAVLPPDEEVLGSLRSRGHRCDVPCFLPVGVVLGDDRRLPAYITCSKYLYRDLNIKAYPATSSKMARHFLT